jgi:hypothetical protein
MVSGQNGIEIAANNVTLDLNGFALLGGGHGGSGIHIPGAQTNITVRNGTISDWVNNGVDSDSYFSMNLVFERLNISANPAFGIYMSGAGVVRDCICENNGTGIFLGSYSEAIGNICIGNGTGIFVVGSNNRIENNHVAASGSGGIQVSGNGNYNNLIIKNSVSGNGANNYVGIAGNIVGPLITNTVSGIITNSNPWANFSF